MVLIAAIAARAVIIFHISVPGNQRSRHNTCGHRYDGITQDHDKRGNYFAYGCHRCHIAIANCGNGNNGPVNTLGNTVKARVMLVLNHIH